MRLRVASNGLLLGEGVCEGTIAEGLRVMNSGEGERDGCNDCSLRGLGALGGKWPEGLLLMDFDGSGCTAAALPWIVEPRIDFLSGGSGLDFLGRGALERSGTIDV